MSIEVNAEMDRATAIYMTGESFVVTVSLRNTDKLQLSSLAWGCVQLHCDQILRASTDGSQKQVFEVPNQSRKTSVPIRGKQSIYSSAPAIIFCDVGLKVGESVQFDHTLTLPLHMPPSFKGHFVRYNWYVSIAVQRVDAPIKMLQLPLKIINVTVDVFTALQTAEETNKNELDNPFLKRESKEFVFVVKLICMLRKKPSIVEIAASKVEEITSARSLRVYEMKSADCVFAIITMFKSFYKLGDEICGQISFPLNFNKTNSITCLQVLVRVETIETNLYGSKAEEHIVQHFTEHFVTAFIKETHFRVPIPLTTVPAFSTEAVKLCWRLHFEFVTSVQQPIKYDTPEIPNETSNGDDNGEETNTLASDLAIETMVWDMYILVHSCNPHNVGLVADVPLSNVSLVV